ncbi:hypothetical protein G5V58_15955 [Nocardioides anomalus]|uniref:histidine kinase n=1 Tax=Nocardioides anomalus TaxID=2712223 RepID=A0A6G6WFR3_9ACTN|nr:histidine kinase dimerization/phospho-acceptor domain-containing protein [Nocardioides anomalus]QIG44072.1 hypothetical protein G5V58_15955 [Nocardioides anomalus]
MTETAAEREELRALLSHELRTPLTTIIGYVEMLSSADTGPLNAQQRRMLERIDVSATRLLEVVETVAQRVD